MTMNPFSIHTETIELQQLLKAAGLCPTGGSAGQAIVDGLVRVDSRIERRKACKIHPGQRVEFDGAVLIVERKAV
ncbi:MAG: RNA-binding S4 domain-containing protein [Candidatus Omnitrophota bacterium]|nr:RNA-binding S4 domain-containing protein [Candidatus Omnitrophota bacterium]